MTTPPMPKPVPNLPIPIVETILLVLSCGLMYWTDMAARRLDNKKVVAGLWLMFAVTVAALVLRFFEFKALHFLWNENAYGSITWTILGTHLTYLLATGAEFLVMVVWMHRHDLDESHALDVTLAGGYWYWAVGTWLACFATVYIGARVL
jgi:cytochrome c oxidase subunit 3